MKKRILIVMLVIISLFTLTGCDLFKKTTNNNKKQKTETVKKEEKKTEKKENKKEEINLTGTYYLIEMTSQDKSYTKSDLDALKENGLEVTLVLKEDKTAVLSLFGATQDLKYDSEYFYAEGEKLKYTYSNGIIKFVDNESSLTFEKAKD